MPTLDIRILGPGCGNCQALEAAARQAVTDLGLDARFTKVTDYADIARHGVMATPGLVVDGTVVSTGRVLTAEQVSALLVADRDPDAVSPS